MATTNLPAPSPDRKTAGRQRAHVATTPAVAYWAPERIAGLRRRLVEQAEAKHTNAPEKTRRLTQQLATLDEQIRPAAQNVLRCTDNIDVLNEGLSELRAERAKVARRLDETEKAQAVPIIETMAEVETALARLETLRERLIDAPPQERGEVLRLLVSRVDAFFEPVEKGRRRWYPFSKGAVKMRPILDVSGCEEYLR